MKYCNGNNYCNCVRCANGQNGAVNVQVSGCSRNSCGCNNSCGSLRSFCNSECNSCCGTSCPQPIPPQPVPPRRQNLASFAEAVANTQTVASGGDVVFSDTEIVGTDIRIDAAKQKFTLLTAGLYFVEWSVNVESAGVVFGILEQGNRASGMYHSGTAGNISSGTLINVTEVPYVISLHNFAEVATLSNPAAFENTCGSIRIIRFADGAKI